MITREQDGIPLSSSSTTVFLRIDFGARPLDDGPGVPLGGALECARGETIGVIVGKCSSLSDVSERDGDDRTRFRFRTFARSGLSSSESA